MALTYPLDGTTFVTHDDNWVGLPRQPISQMTFCHERLGGMWFLAEVGSSLCAKPIRADRGLAIKLTT